MPKKRAYNFSLYQNRFKPLKLRGRSLSLFDFENIVDFFSSYFSRCLPHKFYFSRFYRFRRITSSNIYRCLQYNNRRSVHHRLDWHRLNTVATKSGLHFECSLCNYLSAAFCNFFPNQNITIHEQYKWLAATPDAIIKVISCTTCREALKTIQLSCKSTDDSSDDPYNPLDHLRSVYEIQQSVCSNSTMLVEIKHIGKFLIAQNFDEDFNLIKESEYYYQLHYSMFILNVSHTLLVILNKLNGFIYTKIIEYDPTAIDSSFKNLQDFYVRYRIPYLASKKLKIRKYRKYDKKKFHPILKSTARSQKYLSTFRLASQGDLKRMEQVTKHKLARILMTNADIKALKFDEYPSNASHDNLNQLIDSHLKDYPINSSLVKAQRYCASIDEIRAFIQKIDVNQLDSY